MAANIAVPIQAMVLPECRPPARARPQATPPAMMKLSAIPSTARPKAKADAAAIGWPGKASDPR